MAKTIIPEPLVKKAWAKDTWAAGIHKSYFDKFTGTGTDNIIQIKEELKKEKGDTINIPLLMPLSGAGVTGDNQLENNEEALIYRDFNVSIDQIRNAVRIAGRFEEQKTQQNMRNDAKEALSDWLSKKIDTMCFEALSTDPTADRVVYANTSINNRDGLTGSDSFSADLIGVAKRKATENEDTMIKPMKINGSEHYVMIVDQWQARDLMNDPKWLEAQKHANIRGESNPIFSGALGMYQGVVIHENNRILRSDNASGIKVSNGLFLGKQAAVMAVGGDLRWDEDTFDYGNQIGFSIGRIFGITKSQFKYDGLNLTDFGVINVVTSSVAD